MMSDIYRIDTDESVQHIGVENIKKIVTSHVKAQYIDRASIEAYNNRKIVSSSDFAYPFVLVDSTLSYHFTKGLRKARDFKTVVTVYNENGSRDIEVCSLKLLIDNDETNTVLAHYEKVLAASAI